ncbi:anti sigma factor C-terminal domain-containing protein [Bacillus massiliigorillae]|uniref:anti sigma factor C-terminal domain-containing protein n=1 Tax=Bacillus massiliigorillae TaxID=1243664 RepID=UPI00039E9304|nr:anti sigma factor C-terminal domain-containing protein [Bacillus massiliigorillae]
MREDHEVDHLFDPTFNEENLIKSAKRKSYVRIIGVSFLVSSCVITLLIVLKLQLTPYFINQKITAKELYYEIYGANTYTGNWTEQYKLIGSSANAPKYKLLSGKLVNIGEVSFDSPTIEVNVGKSVFEEYSYSGYRLMNFFHPSISYIQYANDLAKLNQVNEGKLIEMALSFDRDYSYNEVISMLPKEVTLQWNWINAYSKEEIEGLKESKTKFAESPNIILKENQVAGFPSISKSGENIKDPVNTFIETLEIATSKGGSYKEEFKTIQSVLKQGHPTLLKDNVRIIGVVVVGDKHQLKQLLNKTYIKASSFGVITDKY